MRETYPLQCWKCCFILSTKWYLRQNLGIKGKHLHWECANGLNWFTALCLWQLGYEGPRNMYSISVTSLASQFLLNRLFRRRSKKTSRLRASGICEGNPPLTIGFPSQRDSNAGNASIWWRHPVLTLHHFCLLHLKKKLNISLCMSTVCTMWTVSRNSI